MLLNKDAGCWVKLTHLPPTLVPFGVTFVSRLAGSPKQLKMASSSYSIFRCIF